MGYVVGYYDDEKVVLEGGRVEGGGGHSDGGKDCCGYSELSGWWGQRVVGR